eukprot:m.257348 g.257348  ORF g.257348 m.257348 type:complete len:740 (-) comp22707_c0_seq3:50-2269(-)
MGAIDGGLVVGLLLAALQCAAAFEGQWIGGAGDESFLGLLDYSRSLWGECADPSSLTMSVSPLFQTVPMLYSGSEDGLLEGPTWPAYWTQNSYGPTLGSLPFMPDLAFHAVRTSHSWWFNNMADGTNPYGTDGSQGFAPDGCLCDNGAPTSCNYKQGDGNVPLHDWTLEETLSAVVMQAELLLISRNTSDIEHHLPLFLRTSNLLESRRDPASGMTMFLSGPSSNLLAPSFGGWAQDTGKHAWSYMTGVSVTYTAALNRMIECALLVGNKALVQLFTARRDFNLRGLPSYLAPSRAFFVRSVDPNGTLHGVPGQPRYGYFEASPNHDAVALRVVDDDLAAKIFGYMEGLGTMLRPNVFALPNTDATGKPPVKGSGAVGYDDMLCGNGITCGSIWQFGTWVNGGVWTTTEARWLLAAARLNRTDIAAASVQQMKTLFGTPWRMDNPLTNFGLDVYQPAEDINLTIDAFGSAAAFLRGLFEYLYAADTLTLVPHLPDNITALTQSFGVRWGAYRIFLATRGVRSAGLVHATLNGQPLSAPHRLNSSTVTLVYSALPPASPEALAALNSTFRTAFTRLDLVLTFGGAAVSAASANTNTDSDPGHAPRRSAAPAADRPSVAPLNCTALAAAHGLSAARLAKLQNFSHSLLAANSTRDTLAATLSLLALAYHSTADVRCTGLNNGTLPALPSAASNQASVVQMLSTAVNLSAGLDYLFANTLAASPDPLAAQLRALWAASSKRT